MSHKHELIWAWGKMIHQSPEYDNLICHNMKPALHTTLAPHKLWGSENAIRVWIACERKNTHNLQEPLLVGLLQQHGRPTSMECYGGSANPQKSNAGRNRRKVQKELIQEKEAYRRSKGWRCFECCEPTFFHRKSKDWQFDGISQQVTNNLKCLLFIFKLSPQPPPVQHEYQVLSKLQSLTYFHTRTMPTLCRFL